MKTTVLFATMLLTSISFVFSQNIIEKLEIKPNAIGVSDSVFLFVSSKQFSGWCTYETGVDSIIENTIYINGNYDGNNKCWGKLENDSINLGVFNEGEYNIIYHFIDAYGHTTETHKLGFEVGTVGLLDEPHQKTIKIFPNPCTSYVNVSIEDPMNSGTLQLYNLLGLKIYEKKTARQVEIINMSIFDCGIYFIKFTCNNKLYSIKLIKI